MAGAAVASAGKGGAVVWRWRGRDVVVGTTRLGAGPRALLLPALSSISTRAEMAPLAARLAARRLTDGRQRLRLDRLTAA